MFTEDDDDFLPSKRADISRVVDEPPRPPVQLPPPINKPTSPVPKAESGFDKLMRFKRAAKKPPNVIEPIVTAPAAEPGGLHTQPPSPDLSPHSVAAVPSEAQPAVDEPPELMEADIGEANFDFD